MNRISIRNFGPVRHGYNSGDGLLEIKKCTVFIGNQGTGKSTVAKLISTFSWLEKALYRGDITEQYLTSYHRFRKEFCAYQNLKNYFRKASELTFEGNAYDFLYSNEKLTVSRRADAAGYKLPKIMYVPAERNFLSAVDEPEKLKGLPPTLREFWTELQRAQRALTTSSTHVPLPAGNARFRYDRLNRIPWIVGPDYELKLSEASSGFQSFVPLFLVSQYLATGISNGTPATGNTLSGEQEERLRKEMRAILQNKDLLPELRKAALEELSSKFRNERFTNIVEEVEQNLFPVSQRGILNSLLTIHNMDAGNSLLLTTHSPYIINYLTLAIQADYVLRKLVEKDVSEHGLLQQLEAIVPQTACTNAAQVAIYEMTEDGRINKLEDYNGVPSDENYLNSRLGESNELFAQLLEIQLQL